MFNSKARYLNNYFNVLKKIISIPLITTLAILMVLNIFSIVKIIPENLYLDINNPYMNLLTNSLFFGTIGGIIGFIFFIIGIFFKKKCIKVYKNECIKIINTTKFSSKLPKVLYVYTTHNDFIESRILQNMQQTYKNFEVWVSDGSTSIDWRTKVKKFCKKNKINLFQLGIEGSKNKADNINQFLKQYKGNYDYLLIGDADEVFHKNFVEYAMKIFCSNKIKNLGYISPLNINYRSKGIYPNTTRILETTDFYWNLMTSSFTNSMISPLSGQSCLISKKCLIECNKAEKFDDGNLEDWYLETSMVEHMNFGIMLPIAPCYFEPDVNVVAHFNRIMRIEDWRIRWWKIRTKEIINKYNERYSGWYDRYLVVLLRPIIIFIGLALFSVNIWLLINYWDYAFKNNILFWIFIGITSSFALFSLFLNSILIGNINFKLSDYLLFSFVFIMWIFVGNIKVCIHWFKSLILGKYSQFGGSGNFRFLKLKSKTIVWWFSLIFLSIIIVAFNALIFSLANWWNIKWLIIIFNVYVGTIWLGCLSYLILWYINYIPYNSSFNREDWIECKEFI